MHDAPYVNSMMYIANWLSRNRVFRVQSSFHVSPVAGDPTLTSLQQTSSDIVTVMWSRPSGGATVTGYVVHFRTGSSVGTEAEPSIFTASIIRGLTSGATYTISVEATSQHLSGESEEMTISLCEPAFLCSLF